MHGGYDGHDDAVAAVHRVRDSLSETGSVHTWAGPVSNTEIYFLPPPAIVTVAVLLATETFPAASKATTE